MTVTELIYILKEFDQSADVVVYDQTSEDYFPIEDFMFIKDSGGNKIVELVIDSEKEHISQAQQLILTELQKETKKVINKMSKEQKPLDPRFAKIMEENLTELAGDKDD